MKKTFIGIWNYPNNRPNIQTYALCTFNFSLQTFTIFFLINAFINVYYIFLTFITSMLPFTYCHDATECGHFMMSSFSMRRPTCKVKWTWVYWPNVVYTVSRKK